MGVATFILFARAQYGVKMTYAEAFALKETWKASWPEMLEYFAWAHALLNGADRTTLVLPFSGRVRGRCTFTQVCNTPFQGTTADGAKAAMFEVARLQFCEPQSSLYGTRNVVFLHDELVVEAPERRTHEVGQELRRVMCQEYNRFTPDVPVQASPAAMYRWSKDAEPVYQNGELIPWTL